MRAHKPILAILGRVFFFFGTFSCFHDLCFFAIFSYYAIVGVIEDAACVSGREKRVQVTSSLQVKITYVWIEETQYG